MKRAEGSCPDALGFLTVLQHEQLGLVGGYLILNAAGRPLEFHCTAPVKPNRAQQILFGPTLDSYLYGEQIGQTLLSKGSLQPAAVFTNSDRALSVREFVSLPVALVLASATRDATVAATGEWRAETLAGAPGHLLEFGVGKNQLAASTEADREAIVARSAELAAFDLSEPFERIQEAVAEAHKGGRAAA